MSAQVAERGMDITEAAQAFAVMNISVADSLMTCWRAKFDDRLWRPITAIALAADGRQRRDGTRPGLDFACPNPPYAGLS